VTLFILGGLTALAFLIGWLYGTYDARKDSADE